MHKRRYRGKNALINAVIARAREIRLAPYKFRLPKQTEYEKLIAESIASKARKIVGDRRREPDKVDENWAMKVEVPHLCYWAMHPGMDVFADLLEIGELTDDGDRICLPGVRPDQVEARKDLIEWALDGYAEYLIDQKRKAGTHPLG